MNIKINSKSIRFKTLFSLILFSIFIILLLWISSDLVSNFLYKYYQRKDITYIANSVKNYDGNDIDKYLEDLVKDNNLCIEYVMNDSTYKLFNENNMGCMLGTNHSLMKRYISNFMTEDHEMSKVEFNNEEYDAEGILYAIKVDDGCVFLFTMLKNINKTSLTVKSQLTYITVVVIILAILISLFLSNRVSKPITNITAKATKVAEGDYNVKFEHGGIKEVDELADTLNYLEKEVSKTDEYRRDLVANVSHDLKTPLTMIKAYAEMVRDLTYKDEKKRTENLNVIINEVDRLNNLVGDILDISKLEANKDVLNLETFDLEKLVKDIIKRYQFVVDLEDYSIILESPKKVMIKADKLKIDQAIYNLINNAINYTGKDKKVFVTITENEKDYLVEVKDTGAVIEKDKLKDIWDRYYKNEKNHQRNKVGTGLGLSIVKKIFELHKVEYGVTSDKEKGTIFYFKVKKDNSVNK